MKTQIKKVFKACTPPLLISIYKKIFPREKVREYKDYTSALKESSHDSYQNLELCNVVGDKTAQYIETLTKKPFSLNSTNIFLLAAINQYISIHHVERIHILDVGGACGVHYFEIRRFLPKETKLDWIVVETPQMVQVAKNKKLENAELHFVESLENIHSKIDFIHSSSTLQYTPEPYKLLQQILLCKATWVFFNRMMFNEHDREFVTLQKSYLSSNGPGPLPQNYSDKIVSYPHTTLAFNTFNKKMLDMYNLEWIFDEKTGSHPINDEKIIGKGMLYTLR